MPRSPCPRLPAVLLPLLACAPEPAPAPTPGGWQPLDAVASSGASPATLDELCPGAAHGFQLVPGPAGSLLVSWRAENQPCLVQIRDGALQRLPTPEARSISLATAPDDSLVMLASPPHGRHRLMSFDGEGWSLLPEGADLPRMSPSGPMLGLDSAGSASFLTTSSERPGLYHRQDGDWVREDLPLDHPKGAAVVASEGTWRLGWLDAPTQDTRQLRVARWSGDHWAQLAPPEPVPTYTGPLSLVVTPDDEVLAAWHQVLGEETSGSRSRRLYGWHVLWRSGDRWQRLPSPIEEKRSTFPTQGAIALDPEGQPILAWSAEDGEIHAVRWAGAAWEPLGDPAGNASQTAGRSRDPALLRVGERIYLAWLDATSGTTAMRLRVLDGHGFTDLPARHLVGGLGEPTSNAVHPALCSRSEPVVAYQREGEDPGVVVARHTDGGWVRLGGEVRGLESAPTVAVSSRGAVFVAGLGGDDERGPLVVARFDGRRWLLLGKERAEDRLPSMQRGAQGPVLTIAGAGRPVVAWSYLGELPAYIDRTAAAGRRSEPARLHVATWQRKAWRPFGDQPAVPTGAEDAERPALALDREGRPVVAWVTRGRHESVHLRRWDGSAWAEVGGSAVGVCDGARQVDTPSLVLDPDDHPVLAWGAIDDEQRWAPVVCAWDGSRWQEHPPPMEPIPESSLRSGARTVSLSLETGRPVVAWNHASRGEARTGAAVLTDEGWLDLDLPGPVGQLASPGWLTTSGGAATCAAWPELDDRSLRISVACR